MQRKMIGYARVNHGAMSDLELQIAQLKAAGAVEVVSDFQLGVSQERPGFNRLMALIEANQIEAVVVTRFDRLTRSLVQLSQFIEVFYDNGVNLQILDQQLDLRTPTGKLMLCLLGMMAEWERELANEKLEVSS